MSTQTIAVIDYGMGNLRSVSKALEHVAPNDTIIVTDDKNIIRDADKVVFPGVGAVSHCMGELQNHHLIDVVKQASAEKPFLGICLGMQLLFSRSEENNGTDALGIIEGNVPLFPDVVIEQELCVPHMGWNNVSQSIEHPLWQGINDDAKFYFVHSYYVEPTNSDVISGSSHHGITFTASIAKDNIFATQFHPEKSQHDGLQLLENFTKWNGKCWLFPRLI